VRSTQIHEEQIRFIGGMTVTMNGRIAVILEDIDRKCKGIASTYLIAPNLENLPIFFQKCKYQY